MSRTSKHTESSIDKANPQRCMYNDQPACYLVIELRLCHIAAPCWLNLRHFETIRRKVSEKFVDLIGMGFIEGDRGDWLIFSQEEITTWVRH